ncbi:MAG TPA: carboxypeptidase-like regulatory domain-containing protein [Bryobacteraceae bacterium]|nr:carboxypeptidase-like regulatory domain-containing protein [Bryobacteraceae bacterium]
MQKTLRFCCALLLGFGISAFAQIGSISGSVVDEAGNPVAAATVTYHNLSKLVRGPAGQIISVDPRVNSAVRTGTDGTFLIASLPPGTYLLCASGTKITQLRSCEWTGGPTRIDLSSGGTASATLGLTDGTLLLFAVDDPNGHIRDLADLPVLDGLLPLTGENFRLGVMVGSRYVLAQLVSRSGGSRQYEVAVPKGATAKVMLDTSLSVLGVPSTPIAAAGQGPIHLAVQ